MSATQLRQQLDDQRQELGQDLEAIGDRVSPRRMTERKAAAVRDRLGSARDAVMGAKDSVTDKVAEVGDQAGSAGSTITDRASEVADQARQVPERARSGAQGNPLAAGLIAFGGGLLAASLLPSTRREQVMVDQKVQPQLHAVAEQAGSIAQETVEAVKPEVTGAVDEVKGEAQAAVTEVKESAQGSAQEVAEQARSGADEVRPG